MEKSHSLPIIIVGGGIGGMTAALALSQKNIPSILLEQAPQFRETGAGIQLCPNVFKMFDYLGIMDAMKKIAIFPDNLIYVDGINGDRFLNIPLKEPLIERFKYPYGVFHREDLLRGLVNECKNRPLISLNTGARVIHISQDNTHVEVKTEDGRSFKGSALIGCDGLWSVIRDYVVGPETPRFTGHIAYRGVVDINQVDKKLCPNNVVHWVRDHSHLVHYPIGVQGLFNIIAIFQTERQYPLNDISPNSDELEERFEGSQPEIIELLTYIKRDRKWMLYDRDPIKNWTKGRVVLLGDSAHPTLPYLTQGAGMAIEDSVVLAQKITEYGDDFEGAFLSYQEERYLRCAYVQLFSRAYGETHHSSGVARELRDYIISKRSLEDNYEWLAKLYDGIEVGAYHEITK